MKDEQLTVPYIVFESAMDRAERRDRWLIFVIVFLIALLAVSNIVWVIAWQQYDYVADDYSITADQSGEGINIVGGGDVDYGAESNDQAETDSKNT